MIRHTHSLGACPAGGVSAAVPTKRVYTVTAGGDADVVS